jgi:membrane protein DedA with SNARE-associated domain
MQPALIGHSGTSGLLRHWSITDHAYLIHGRTLRPWVTASGAGMFEWIVGVVSSAGYIGVAALMALENLFPPIPSELIMPVAGFAAARGDLTITGVILAGTAGSVIGTLPWYWLGRRLGRRRIRHLAERHGRWLTISPDEVDRAHGWFERHGGKAVFFGRLIPAIRTLISVPAGIAAMPMGRYLAWSTLGSLIWTSLLALAGYVLESQYDLVAAYMDPVSKGVIALMVLTYLYRVVRRKG